MSAQLITEFRQWINNPDKPKGDIYITTFAVQGVDYNVWFGENGDSVEAMVVFADLILALSNNGAQALFNDIRPQLANVDPEMKLHFDARLYRVSVTTLFKSEDADELLKEVGQTLFLINSLRSLFETVEERDGRWDDYLVALAVLTFSEDEPVQ